VTVVPLLLFLLLLELLEADPAATDSISMGTYTFLEAHLLPDIMKISEPYR
jgi:hypothetical protein